MPQGKQRREEARPDRQVDKGKAPQEPARDERQPRQERRPAAEESLGRAAAALGDAASPAEPLAAQRVLPITDEPAAAPKTIACPRCNGACEHSELFCKYCGGPLAGKDESRARTGDTERPTGHAKRAPAKVRREAGPRPEREPFPLTKKGPLPEAQPAPQQEVTGKLVVIVEDGSEGKVLELKGQQVDIGSAEGDIVLTEDRYLSPRHARFFRHGGIWYLRDLDSTNGVYRRLRKPEKLKDGDLVLLGLEVLQFRLLKQAERGLGHATQHGTLVFGSPAATRRARLCQRTVEGIVRDVYHLVSDETTIGREIGDIVFTSDPFMSRRHAAVRWQESTQEYILADLNSSNGTYLAIGDDVRLENGDFIRLGQHLFRVDLPRHRSSRS